MNRLSICFCRNQDLPRKDFFKIRLEPEFGLEMLNKFDLKGTPVRTFLTGNHIFVQFKDDNNKYHIIVVCQMLYILVAMTDGNTIYVKDSRLTEYIQSIWNHNVVKKNLFETV